nr:immunoglobulin heavy chain junction region [Macaca mulatta]
CVRNQGDISISILEVDIKGNNRFDVW